ncbi:serine hydrolase [Bradyrhizobium sp. STM 3557]|uniref:serine hydrolase n=1 Tax=Bradyrhizobium sp. STM 3557 TaxID=578920 RepID=UPI00388E8588
MRQEHIPSLAIAIVGQDGAVWSKGFGFADLGRTKAMTPDTIFPVGSISKRWARTGELGSEERSPMAVPTPSPAEEGVRPLARGLPGMKADSRLRPAASNLARWVAISPRRSRASMPFGCDNASERATSP